jgi:hypothetical protein
VTFAQVTAFSPEVCKTAAPAAVVGLCSNVIPGSQVWSMRAVRANASLSAAIRAARTSGGPMNAWLLV